MIEPIVFFALLGGIIFIGFAALQLFQKTKISDVLILIALGILIGPVFKLVESGLLFTLMPIIAPLALIMLLFEGGLTFNIRHLVSELPLATAFTFTTFICSTLAIAAFLIFLIKWDAVPAFILGAILGGTSSAIVMPLTTMLHGDERIKDMAKIESALTDALCLVVALTLAGLLIRPEAVTLSEAAKSMASMFSIAAMLGIIVGIAWLVILRKLHGKPYGYLLTLAMAFLLYAACEWAGGNGGVGVLVYGIILGNALQISKAFRLESVELSEEMKHFQREVSFFVRTFFFVYIGLLFDPKIVNLQLVVTGCVLLIAILVARALAVRLFAKQPEAQRLLFILAPRGLAAAVLATMLSATVKIPLLIEAVLFTIILTNITTSAGVFIHERKWMKRVPKIVKVARQR